MANKKISELAVRTPSLTDLMLVGDPSTGYSYKATISSLSTLLEANIALDDLNDVTITSPTAGQVLSYNGTAWVNDTNGITGTGTTNYVPKFTSSSAIGNSQIFDNGTNVGIGTATPSDKFSVEGFISTNGTAGTGGIMLRQSGSEITRIYATPSRSILTSTQQINLSINYGLNLTIFPTGNVGVKISDDTDSGDAFQVLGTVKFRTINNATTDTDKFIVSDGGVIKYRTGSEVLSDIGGAAASSISGTTNYIPKFTSSSAIGNSQIFDNGTSVGIATSSPQTQLDIANGLMFGTIDAFPSATYDAAAVIAKTGSLGSAPFNNAGSIVYRARVTSTAGRSSHIFYTGSPSTERMRLDESGNLGLGVTPSAWASDWRVMQVGTRGSIGQYSGQTWLANNVFYAGAGGTNPTYIATATAQVYQQAGGQHIWYTAPSGTAGNAISFTQAMTLDASGRLGIGTATPQSILDITAATPIMTIIASTNTVLHGIEWKAGTSLDAFIKQLPVTGEFRISNGRSAGWGGFITFYTDTSERMRLTSAGELLINTTSDAGDYKLQVNGNSYLAGSFAVDATSGVTSYRTSFIGGIYKSNSGGGSNPFISTNNMIIQGYTDGSAARDIDFVTGVTPASRLYINTSGNVGIGTTSPAQQLEIKGAAGANTTIQITSNNSNDFSSRIFFADNVSQRGYIAYSNFSNFLAFGTNSAEVARFTSAGELLINTTSDAGDYKLQVNGAYYGKGRVYLSGTGFNVTGAPSLYLENTTATTGRTYALNSYNSGGFQIFDVTNANATVFLINSSGNAEIPSGSIKTAAPSGGTAKPWKLGGVQSTTIVLDDGAYVDVEIDGVAYKLALAVIP